MPKQRDPREPNFPHGTDTGYGSGCRDSTGPTCPATPTCTQQHTAAKARWRRGASTIGAPKTVYVRRRMNETLTKIDRDRLLAHTGLSAAEVAHVETTHEVTLDTRVAFALDQAWALYVHGVNVLDPDFRHGTTGYQRKCRCDTCRAGAASTQARSRAGVAADTALLRDPATAARVARRAQLIIERTSTMHEAARAAGLAREVLERAAAHQPITNRSARAILAVKPSDLARARTPKSLTDASLAQHQVRTLWANGYPLDYLGARIGLTKQEIQRIGKGKITVARAALIAGLAADLGDEPATPDGDTLTEDRIGRAARAARRAGWYPPMFYDERGVLDPRAIPEHPWSRLDDLAARRLAAVLALTRGDLGRKHIARTCGFDPKTVDRYAKRLGLTCERHGSPALSAAGKAAAARIWPILDQWDDGSMDCVAAAFTLGLLHINEGIVPSDHPEVVAWVARQATADTTTYEEAAA